MFTARPHDLLRLSGPAALPADSPEWATDALRRMPWVVVRRAPAATNLIAVGVRGPTRSERYGTHVAVDDVREVVTPESLAKLTWCRELPALRTLESIRPLLDRTGLSWGLTGSVGFELATGRATATRDSDLDLLVRTDDVRDALPRLTGLHYGFRSTHTRVDCQVETSSGAVALAELVGGHPDVLMRTSNGPRLVPRAAVS
jgi:phosphoribosyl-dephospho-CoA transferase